MNRTLYELGERCSRIMAILEQNGGELTDPQLDAEFAALSEAMIKDEPRELDYLVNFIRRKESEARAAREEADFYARHADRAEAVVKRAKNFAKSYIECTGRTSVLSETGRVLAVQANGGVVKMRYTVDNIDPASVPEEFTKRVMNDAAVRRGLEERNPEALAIAVLEERGHHLRIR